MVDFVLLIGMLAVILIVVSLLLGPIMGIFITSTIGCLTLEFLNKGSLVRRTPKKIEKA